MKEEIQFLEHIAYQLRRDSILATTQAGSGHPTSCLSAADIVAALFFYAMTFDPKNHENLDNDRFILSKGHAAPLFYAVCKQLGVISHQELMTLRQFDSRLEGHPTPQFMYNEAATGSLGQGLSIGLGMAYVAKMDKRDFKTYVLMGDSEITEGSIWEAAQLASHYHLNNLIGIVDVNGLGQSTQTIDDYHLDVMAHKFTAFGWHALIVDGHDISDIVSAFDKIPDYLKNNSKPVVLLAKTIKGYPITRVQGKEGFHGKLFLLEELENVLHELQEKFPQAANYHSSYVWHPHIPERKMVIKQDKDVIQSLPDPLYQKSKSIATRKAFGQALVQLGKVNDHVVSLDAEVKNSTYADMFEDAFPKKFIQCFIAEQNMIGMGIGMASRGKIPFISTFASFFTRAFDQIRMAAIGRSPLRLVGSHAGVSIGEDGPSQMGLEDIAMMRVIPDSIVLYPADAVTTYKLVEQMANYHTGISYLRTTRMETPVIYDNNEEFKIGGCKILRCSEFDAVCVIGAGVTLFEALKAYNHLKEQGVYISVIDLYSIKPLDRDAIIACARLSSCKIITVEDHYAQGGISEAVRSALSGTDIEIASLAITSIPRSGKPFELLAFYKIDAHAIVEMVQKMII